VDVISAFSTDGRIAAYDLSVLADERHAIPPYDAIVLIGRRLSTREPAAAAALAKLSRSIDSERMRRANLAVDLQHQAVADVARELGEPGRAE